MPTNEAGQTIVARVHHYAKAAGRDPARLPLEGRIRLAGQSPAGWVEQVQAWGRLGATHVIGEARGGSLTFPDQHLTVLQQFKAVMDAQ